LWSEGEYLEADSGRLSIKPKWLEVGVLLRKSTCDERQYSKAGTPLPFLDPSLVAQVTSAHVNQEGWISSSAGKSAANFTAFDFRRIGLFIYKENDATGFFVMSQILVCA
jgi:hypothetical protein